MSTTSASFTSPTFASWNSSDGRAAGNQRQSGLSALFTPGDGGWSGLSRMVGGAELAVRISYEWLGDFVDLEGVTAKDAADVLTRLEVEVESLVMADLSQILIGKVLEQMKHPTSRNDLWVHQVDVGGKTQQIIAGAPNAVPGSLVPVALPGSTVPNGTLVKDNWNIAGYKGSGMLCSSDELL